MINLHFEPWSLRGYTGTVWQVYVEITESCSITQLIEVKKRLNSPSVKGVVLATNKSKALQRLGDWKELDSGVWYKVFT